MRAPSLIARAVAPTWETDPGAQPRQVFVGNMRIVNRQRARTLRRRGVALMRHVDTTATGKHRHAWFTE